jgi:cyclase
VDFGASAVAAASIFQFTELTPLGAREFLAENGVPVRDSETAH